MRHAQVVISGIAIVALVLSGAAVHDAFAGYVQFDKGLLCQRADGSMWRDSSFGCITDDPRCWPNQCIPSKAVAEGWRHACTWLFFEMEMPPTGEPPYFTGDAAGAGCPGKSPNRST